MNLKRKLAVYTYTKLIKCVKEKNPKISNSVENVANKAKMVNDVKNTLNNKANIVKNIENIINDKADKQNFLQTIQKTDENYLIIRMRSYALDITSNLLAGKKIFSNYSLDLYEILNISKTIKYKLVLAANGSNYTTLNFYDNSNKLLGRIKESPVFFKNPLSHDKTERIYSIYLGKQKIAKIKKIITSNSIKFESLEGSIKITHPKKGLFKIYNKSKLIAALYSVPVRIDNNYIEKFILVVRTKIN